MSSLKSGLKPESSSQNQTLDWDATFWSGSTAHNRSAAVAAAIPKDDGKIQHDADDTFQSLGDSSLNPPEFKRSLSWEDLEGPDTKAAESDLYENRWKCTKCTYLNESDVTICAICEEPRSNGENVHIIPSSDTIDEQEDVDEFEPPALPRLERLRSREKSERSSDGTGSHVFDVIFIGGGPVGLWTAVQLKILRPDLEILVYEKYQEYQRKHVLKLDKASFKGAATKDSAALAELVQSLEKYVRTSELEEKLTRLAKDLKVQFRYEAVASVQALQLQHPKTRVFVGSDGSHSIMRRDIFGNDMELHESLQCILDLKYEVQGEAHKMRFFDQAYPTLKLMNHVGEEHVGKLANGITPLTLRLLLDAKTYRHIKDASFKNPFLVPTHREQIGSQIMHSITVWLNAKAVLCGERRVPGSEKITGLNLSVYQSRNVVRLDSNQKLAYVLVGDAAFGVPFFRALNNGLLCGTRLALALAEFSDENDQDWNDFSQALQRYEKYLIRLSWQEIGKARSKKALLTLGQIATQLNGNVPWQIIRWSDDRVRLLTERDPGFSLATADPEVLKRCAACQAVFNPNHNVSNQCCHTGELHTAYAHCNMKCAEKLSFNGLAGPLVKLGNAHWSCCYAMADQEWCVNSGPHALSLRRCRICCSYYNPMNNVMGQCAHKGKWHTSLIDCGVTCAWRMSLIQYGHCHWSCCHSTQEKSPCPKSSLHEPDLERLLQLQGATTQLICSACFHSYDPAANSPGQCKHAGQWHDTYAACASTPLKCTAGLGISRLGRPHYSCCYSVIYDSVCVKSKPHYSK